MGFSLWEINEIVDIYDVPPGEAGQLNLLIKKIDDRRARLLQQRSDIAVALRELDTVSARCIENLKALHADENMA